MRHMRGRLQAMLVGAVLFGGAIFAPSAGAVTPYQIGDVFAGVGAGQIRHFSPTGVLLETLNTTSGSSEQTGMCFDAPGNLYSTNWTANNMSKFDNLGGLLVHPWGGPFNSHPESCAFDSAGNVYVGEADGNRDIHKFSAAGAPLGTWSPATQSRGLDWIDLAADQCTMFYTSEGSSVKRFDVCTNTQLADFASGLSAPCFALRIRANGEVLVTCSTQTYRLTSGGGVMQTYPIPGEFLFAMNLDPDGAHFWTGGYSTRNVYKVNIATGVGTAAPLFNAGVVGGSLAGLAVFGEPTAAVGNIALTPPTAENEVGTSHTATATISSGGNPVPSELVSFSVTVGPNIGATGACTPATCITDANGQVSWSYTSNGTAGTDTIQACFDDNGTTKCATASKEWIDTNDPPSVDAGGAVSGNEGSAIALDGTVSDPDGDTVTTLWTYAPLSGVDAGATCSFADATAVDTTITCTDDGIYTATLTGNDGNNPPVSDSTTMTVANVNPAVSISAPLANSLWAIGTTVVLTAPFTDAGTNDTHTCTVNWDDGVGPVAGAVAESPGTGTCSASKTFNAAGVYTIAVAATDDDLGVGTASVMIIVYDPNAGFVTGGGWINSPAGAYVSDTTLAGRANFGFVSKYKKGATVPTGETEFQFQAGSFNFHSDAYQWLVVAGCKAQYKGTGTVNGVVGYGFLLTATDGNICTVKTTDKFRIKVWLLSTSAVVYDNKIGSPVDIDSADPQTIAGGSIVVHK